MHPAVGIPTRLRVFGMPAEDGVLRMDDLLPIASARGSGPEQPRSCLRRLVAEGALESREAQGRPRLFHF
jgi:hypothetical protein